MPKILRMSKVEKSPIPTWFLGLGAMSTTLIFLPNVQDPFNLPKFVALLVFTVIGLYLVLVGNLKTIKTKQHMLLISLVGIFLTSFLVSSLNSGNTYQSLVGIYQRNLGFSTYACFALLFLITIFQFSNLNTRKFLIIFVVTGTLEVLYGIIQISGLDPMKWKNPYSPIIGTFGNPNYQSAFLGVTAAAAVGLILTSKGLVRALLVFQVIASLFLVISSNSSQGMMSFTVSTAFIFVNYARIKNIKFFFCLLISSLTLLIIGILGLLQIGPAKFLYQASISARGDYWRAALSMLTSNPFTGVGIERYGEFFSQFRDRQQVTGRSFATYSDNAHNIFLHFGATGGFPLLISYLVLFIAVIAVGLIKLHKEKSPSSVELSTFVGLFLGFVAISFISPENIGFTIWAWLIGGVIVGLGLQSNAQITSRNGIGEKKIKSIAVIVCLSMFFTVGTYATKMLRADRNIWEAFSIAYSGTGTLDDLLKRIQFVTEIAPSEQRYKVLAASLSLGLDQRESARNYAEQVIKINPLSIDAHNIIALSFEKEQKFKNANQIRAAISKFDPFNLYNYDRIARNYLEADDLVNAEKYLKIMRDIQASNSLVVLLEEDLASYSG